MVGQQSYKALTQKTIFNFLFPTNNQQLLVYFKLIIILGNVLTRFLAKS